MQGYLEFFLCYPLIKSIERMHLAFINVSNDCWHRLYPVVTAFSIPMQVLVNHFLIFRFRESENATEVTYKSGTG